MSTTDTPLTRLLNISEVADVLGVDVRHVRRLVYERRIPFDAPMDRQVGGGPAWSWR
jgi:excisionase family DNA binding protein